MGFDTIRILYHLTVLPPRLPAAEALSQEVDLLRRSFGGAVNYLNPNRHRNLSIPRLLFGLSQLAHLRRKERNIDLHQIYNPDPFPFPLFALLRKPIVYVVSSGVSPDLRLAGWSRSLLRRVNLVTPDRRSAALLEQVGVGRVTVIPTGIDLDRVTASPPPDGPLRLLMASAPWTLAQFQSKGVDALLDALCRLPELHITFLWRGVHGDEMQRRIASRGLGNRARFVDGLTDIDTEIRRVHGVILLAAKPGLVKSFPHSLLEGLVAGRPVILSRAIPMADYVAEQGCGQMVEALTVEDVVKAISRFEDEYDVLADAASRVGRRDFGASSMIEGYSMLYQTIRERGVRGR